MTLSAIAAAIALSAGPAAAAEYVIIPLETTIARPAPVAWKALSGFCDVGAYAKMSCVITSGAGEVGTVRRLADRIDELMVGKTAWSYTYTQPKSPIDYHGTVEIRAEGPRKSRLFYTLVYDAAPLATPEAKAADRERRTRQFTAILAAMKAGAEGR